MSRVHSCRRSGPVSRTAYTKHTRKKSSSVSHLITLHTSHACNFDFSLLNYAPAYLVLDSVPNCFNLTLGVLLLACHMLDAPTGPQDTRTSDLLPFSNRLLPYSLYHHHRTTLLILIAHLLTLILVPPPLRQPIFDIHQPPFIENVAFGLEILGKTLLPPPSTMFCIIVLLGLFASVGIMPMVLLLGLGFLVRAGELERRWESHDHVAAFVEYGGTAGSAGDFVREGGGNFGEGLDFVVRAGVSNSHGTRCRETGCNIILSCSRGQPTDWIS